MRYGTAHFRTMASAARYYRDYEPDGLAAAQRKLRAGEIHIGKPQLKPGQQLILIDNGSRYAIEDDTP